MMRVISTVTVAYLCAGALIANADVASGIEAYNQGRYSVAIRELEPVRKGDERARIYLGLAQAASGRCDTALPVLSAEADGVTALARLAGLGAVRCLSGAGKIAQALGLVEQLKAHFPGDADVLYVAAETEMKAFNDTTFSMFQRAPASYRVHELSARIFEVQNRFHDAVTEYNKAIEANPAAPDLHFRLGRALLLENHSAEALQAAAEAFRSELAISPEDSATEFQLGQVAQALGNSKEARQHFERALQLSPDFVAAMVPLAGSYSHDGQNERAIALLKQAVALQPDNEAAHYALLSAYRNAGQPDDARAEKVILDRLQRPPEGEFSDFLKRLGDGQAPQ